MLSNESTILKPIEADDLKKLYVWINDRKHVIYSASYKPVTFRKHQDWYEEIQRRNDLYIFGIHPQKENIIIGTCQLLDINYTHKTAELRIRIGDDKFKKLGHGENAIKLLLDFAFKDLNLHRVYLYVFSTNKAAINLYKKVGFISEGTLRQAAYVDGKYIDIVFMGILKHEHKE